MADLLPQPPEPTKTYSPNPFNKIPLETIQNIASCVDYDSELCNFRLICRSTLDAVDADNCSFWRRRFLGCFEKPTTVLDNVAFKKAYQKHKGVLKCGAVFVKGDGKRERECLEVVRDLVLGGLLFLSPLIFTRK